MHLLIIRPNPDTILVGLKCTKRVYNTRNFKDLLYGEHTADDLQTTEDIFDERIEELTPVNNSISSLSIELYPKSICVSCESDDDAVEAANNGHDYDDPHNWDNDYIKGSYLTTYTYELVG